MSTRLLASLCLIAPACLCFGQTGTFSPQVSVFNNLNSTAGSNGVGIAAGDTASILFTRSVNVWSDTWWQWTMGTDNKLRLGFSTVPQLTLQNGAFGIGTDTPSARLDVAGNIALNDNKLLLRQGYDGGHYIAGEWAFPGSPTGFGVKIFSSNSPIMLTAGGLDTLYASASGLVGIGTTNPTQRLDVNGAIAFGSGDVWSAGTIYSDPNWGVILRAKQASPVVAEFMFANAAGTERIRINPSGNVGIGNIDPGSSKLAVNGTVRAREIIVETTVWSDYVFADDYALTPLAEVETHIKEHKHLPGIPSAAQVAEQGIAVGDMQARLLAKIEELTLHQIAQEKELTSLRAKVARLESIDP